MLSIINNYLASSPPVVTPVASASQAVEIPVVEEKKMSALSKALNMFKKKENISPPTPPSTPPLSTLNDNRQSVSMLPVGYLLLRNLNSKIIGKFYRICCCQENVIFIFNAEFSKTYI